MPLYHIDQTKVVFQIKSSEIPTEPDLQKLFESNLEMLLGVWFIASELTTGDRQHPQDCFHRCRISTRSLGHGKALDEVVPDQLVKFYYIQHLPLTRRNAERERLPGGNL